MLKDKEYVIIFLGLLIAIISMGIVVAVIQQPKIVNSDSYCLDQCGTVELCKTECLYNTDLFQKCGQNAACYRWTNTAKWY